VLVARRWLGIAGVALLATLSAAQSTPSSSAQQATPAALPQQPVPPAAASPAAQQSLEEKPHGPRTLEEAREQLRAWEQVRPENKKSLVEALVDLVHMELITAHLNEDTVAEIDRALTLAEADGGKESRLYAMALAAKSRIVLNLDRPEVARPLAEEALEIEQRLGNDPVELADAASALSNVCQKAGDDPCALKNTELQVKAIRSEPDRDPTELATALIDLMANRRHSGDVEGAKAALEECMAIAAHNPETEPNWAIIENNAGGFYLFIEDYARGVEHLKRALELTTKLHGADSVSQSSMLANLGYAEMCLGNGDEGLKYYARAREMYMRRYGASHSMMANLETSYGRALSFTGDRKVAIEKELFAHRLLRERIQNAIRLMPERQALALANSASAPFNVAVSITALHPDIATADVYQEIVRSRALVADEMAERQAALNRKHDPAVAALEQELETERKAVLDLQGAAADNSAAALAEATAKMEHTERALAERSAAFRTDERTRASELADLRRNMPAGSVLVSYVLFQKYTEEIAKFHEKPTWWYMALVLHRNSPRIGVYDVGDAKSMAELVTKMRASADAEAHGGGLGSTRNEREYREAGDALRKRVWDPLKSELAGAKLVFVVPDGRLNLLPFAGLPDGTGYLVEHGPVIHVLTIERDLLPGAPAEKKAGLLAVGSPTFELAKVETASDSLPATLRDAPMDCEAFKKMEFGPLPASLTEVRDISSSWKRWNAAERAQVLTGDEATRAQFLEAAPQSRVLHVATHAFVLEDSCGNGNPLLRSGLVFAGANTSRNASILTAQQIASMDLRGVDWAVLSACNTGNGELRQGEGVLGLERSFRVAGARSVIMALWPVDDAATREFMRTLYAERFARHATTADAVWISARTTLRQRRLAGKSTHPWYWAGFVGAGAWQ
jgi:CHAT domain-containing protein